MPMFRDTCPKQFMFRRCLARPKRNPSLLAHVLPFTVPFRYQIPLPSFLQAPLCSVVLRAFSLFLRGNVLLA